MDGMNQKRQRRPNVRLGEIGDVSAAVLSGTSLRPVENWEETRWKAMPGSLKELARQPPFVFSREIAKSRKPCSVNRSNLMCREVQVDAAMGEQRRNCFDKGIGAAKSSGQDDRKRSLELGPIVKKVRHTKVRGGGFKGGGFGDRVWKSTHIGVSTTNEIGKSQGEDGFEDHAAANTYNGHEQFKDSDFETSASPHYAKELSGAPKDLSPDAVVVNFDQSLSPRIEDEWVDPLSDGQVQVDSGDYQTDNCKDNNGGSSHDANCMELPCGGTSRLKNDINGSLWDQRTGSVEKILSFTARVSGIVFDSVTGWLDELGFGKYAHIFEIHEVDKEVLPLLTFEDLKEMGINAVGPRRKIYTAIQLLKEDFSA